MQKRKKGESLESRNASRNASDSSYYLYVTRTYSLVVSKVTGRAASNGVQPELVWLPIRIISWGHNANGLTLSVGNLACT